MALVDSSIPLPFPLAVVARQQQRRGAKMINSDWQVLALGVGLMDK